MRSALSALLAPTVTAAITATACQRDTTSSPDLFAATPWTLSDRETRIGSVDDPDYIFGAVLGMALGPDGLLYKTHRRESSIRRWTADGRTSARVWEQPREPHDVFWILTDRGGSVRGQPFEDSYLLAFGQRGLLVVERRAWTGEGEPAIRVTGIGFDGDTTFRVAVPYNPVPLARERIDSVVHAWVEEEPDDPGAFTPSEAQIREALYQPSYLPAVDHLLEADDGTIWLRRFDRVQLETGEQMIEWWVLDSAATPLARALTPVGLDVRLITSDMVWGIERDELDIEYIVRCRLTKDG